MKNINRIFCSIFLLFVIFSAPGVAHADQPGWQDFGGSINNTVWTSTVDVDGTLYLGGDFTINPAGAKAGYVSRFFNGVWETQGYGTDGAVLSIFAVDPQYIYTGGVFSNIIREQINKKVNRIVRFDGHGWEYVGAGANNIVWAVSANSRNNVYIGGSFTKVTNYNGKAVGANYIARWDGNQWYNLKTGLNGIVRAIAVAPDGTMYAGGTFSKAGGYAANNIAKWNGKNWSPVGSGVNGGIRALQFDSTGRLLVGGNFTMAGGIPANGLAVWDGSAWSTLGTGASTNGTAGTVYSIQVAANNDIYIGGTFAEVNGIRVNNVAHWDGTAWSSLGNGISDKVYTIALDKTNNKLYAAGGFQKDGSQTTTLNRVAVFDLANQ